MATFQQVLPGRAMPRLKKKGTFVDQRDAMHRGDSVMPVSIMSVALLVLVGVVYLLYQSDHELVFEDAAAHVNVITEKHFGGFWQCALPNVNLGSQTSVENLRDQISNRAIRGGTDYADRVRKDCLQKLALLEGRLATTTVPGTLRNDVEAMRVSSRRLTDTWTAYLSYLAASESVFNENTAEPMLMGIAREWQAFNSAKGSFDGKIRREIE
jgi:hypothetical protein